MAFGAVSGITASKAEGLEKAPILDDAPGTLHRRGGASV